MEHLSPEMLLAAPQFSSEQLGHQLGSTLIVGPHPDDESLGCGGLILHLRSQGVDVHVLFMTSGSASHPNSVRYPKDVLSTLREAEAVAACTILGIESTMVEFLRGEDAKLSCINHHEKGTLTNKVTEYISEHDFSTVFVPWRRDPHPDHMATYEIVTAAINQLSHAIQIVEYPIWLWKNSKTPDWPKPDEIEPYRLSISEYLNKKKAAIYAHKSQTSSLIQDDLNGFILTPDLLEPFTTEYEYFFFPVKGAQSSLDKNYFDSLYANNSDPWDFKNSDYETEKYRQIDSILPETKYQNALELGCSIGVHTRFLASHTDHLLSIDISEQAVEEAQSANQDLSNVIFQVEDVLKTFPKGPFDFISMCEIGYYFTEEKLREVFAHIHSNLLTGGQLLMVHWTSYVKEYPLSGKQVHALFELFNLETGSFKRCENYIHERYTLELWEKISSISESSQLK